MLIKNTSDNNTFYATPLSAGFDICSTEEGLLNPGEYRVFKTGLFLELNSTIKQHLVPVDSFGFPMLLTLVEELQVRPRSGLAAKSGVTVLNSPGTVDADYPNEIGVILINHGKNPFYVAAGNRIAQGVVALVVKADGVGQKPDVRVGGFGST